MKTIWLLLIIMTADGQQLIESPVFFSLEECNKTKQEILTQVPLIEERAGTLGIEYDIYVDICRAVELKDPE